MRVGRTLGAWIPNLSFLPWGLKPQGLVKWLQGSKPLPVAAYPVLEIPSPVFAVWQLVVGGLSLSGLREQERNRSFSVCAEAEPRGSKVAGLATAHAVSAVCGATAPGQLPNVSPLAATLPSQTGSKFLLLN